MLRRAAKLCLIPLLPVLFAQGLATRRRVPRLPAATGDSEWLIEPLTASSNALDVSRAPLRLIGLGDSTIKGVGTNNMREALTAQVAAALAATTRRPVAWRAVGKSGFDALSQYGGKGTAQKSPIRP